MWTAKKIKDVHWGDRLFYGTLKTLASLVIVTLLAVILLLLYRSWESMSVFGWKFFTGFTWDPIQENFSALAFIYGTLVSTMLALLLATPISLGTALFLSDLAPARTARILGFMVEMLAAVPSVVYGLWGIFVLAPWLRTTLQPFLQKYFSALPLFSGPFYGVSMMASGIILAIMIIPTITCIARDVFKTIPTVQREAALALGATRWESIWVAVFRSSWAGVVGAVMMGMGRALGETMAVTMVIGNRNEISASLFAPGQTMASLIANEYAEAVSDLHLSALAEIGLSLLVVSLTVNSLARFWVWRVNRAYT